MIVRVNTAPEVSFVVFDTIAAMQFAARELSSNDCVIKNTLNFPLIFHIRSALIHFLGQQRSCRVSIDAGEIAAKNFCNARSFGRDDNGMSVDFSTSYGKRPRFAFSFATF